MAYSNDLRLKVIRCIKDNKMTNSEIMSMFNISKKTFYSIKNDKTIQGNNKYHYSKKNKKTSSKNQKRKSKITILVKKYVVNYVTSRGNFNYNKLIAILYKKFDISISKSSIYKILKDSRITRKKISNKIILTNIVKRNEQINIFKKQISKILKKSSINNIISIDETSIDSHISSTYGWSKSGDRIKNIVSHKRIRYTLILATSCKKIIHSQVIRNSVNGEIFIGFIKGLLKKINRNKENYILLDNARIHHYKKLKEYIESKSNISLIYNIPYTPQTNPIEFVFNDIKRYLKKKYIDNDNLPVEIKKSLKTIKCNTLKAYFDNSLLNELEKLE